MQVCGPGELDEVSDVRRYDDAIVGDGGFEDGAVGCTEQATVTHVDRVHPVIPTESLGDAR